MAPIGRYDVLTRYDIGGCYTSRSPGAGVVDMGGVRILSWIIFHIIC